MATFYFSSSTGNDSTGLGTAASPWANFKGKKDTAAALSAGDICLFKTGDVWYGSNAEIKCISSGADGNPIVFDKYGSGALADPIFCGSTSYTNWTLQTFTCTADSTTDLLTRTSHGLVATSTNHAYGTKIYFTASGSLPGNISAGVPYYVISSGLTANSFKVSTSIGGAAVNISSNGSGVSYNAATYVSGAGTTYPFLVGVDQTYSLFLTARSYLNLQSGAFQRASGLTYIRLIDDSAPSGHTIYLPYTTFSNNYVGNINAGYSRSGGSKTNGNYVEFNHLTTMYNNSVGFSSSGTKVRFNDCYSMGNALEGFLFRRDVNQESITTGSNCDAQYTRAYRCLATYNNASGSGYGQAFTTLASYTWWVDCIAVNNAMAGFDFLDFGNRNDADPTHMGTLVNYCGAVNCKAYNNGQTFGTTNFDPPIYNDGGEDILIYGCHAFGSGINNQAYNSGESSLYLNAEHCVDRTKPVNRMYIINNLIYDSNYDTMGLRADQRGEGGTTTGNEFINNTIIKSNNSNGGGAFRLRGLTTSGVRMRNNIIYKTTGSTPAWRDLNNTDAGTNGAYIDSNYNVIYNAGGSPLQYGGTSISLATWQAAPYSQDANSYADDPQLLLTAAPTWTTLTVYNFGDYVTNSGTTYLCIKTHTAGTFATDLAALKWQSISTYYDVHLRRNSLDGGTTSPGVGSALASPWTPPSWIATAGVLTDNGAVVGTTRSDFVSDSGPADMGYHYFTPTPYGVLTATNVQPATLFLGTVNTNTISFTTANIWPSTGTVVITYSTTLGGGFTFDSGGTSVAAFTIGGSGSLTMTRVGSVITLTRSGGSDISAGTAVSLTITKVLNPPQAGATGPYQVKTTDSAGAVIDIDSNVSSDQIIAPPAGYITITISGVSMANVKISSV